MTRSIRIRPDDMRLSALVVALAAAFGPAHAQSGTADGSVTVGAGALSGSSADRARFGQYNGLRTGGRAVGMLGADYYRRDDEAGTSVQFQGSNLLGHTRELGALWKKQGDWKLAADYGEAVRYEPNTVNTGLIGAGTATPQVVPLTGGPASGADLDLKLKRTHLGLGLWKSIGPNLDLEVSLKTENKDGARLYGTGMNCPSTSAPGCLGATGITVGSALLMLPEPIKSNHSQIEARLSFADEKLRLSGGYYGSFHNNAYDRLAPGVPGSLYNPAGTLLPLGTGLQAILNQPRALPPDNQAHHFDLTGGYAVTRTTQLRFKLGYAVALQHQSFADSGFTSAPAGVDDLGGKVITQSAQVGVTSRPMPKLTLGADLRYQAKDDSTPVALYNVEGTSTYTNRLLPNTRTRAKVLAAYQFSGDYRGSLGADFESIDRGVFTATSAVSGVSALRQKTDETGVRAELRRIMTENFSTSLSLESSRRDGSNWLRDNSGLGVTEVTDPGSASSGLGPTAIFMPTLADRQRDKVKVRADWQAAENLSLQFSAEDGTDKYTAPSQQGLRSTGMRSVAVDWDYAWSERWNFNGYLSRSTQRLHQSRPAGYILSFDDTTDGIGLGFAGRPIAKYEVGGNLSYFDGKNVYAQSLDAFASADSAALLAATGGLPDVVFRQVTLKLFGKYEIDKQSSARVDLIHQRSRLTDWMWGYNGVPFTYSDGSTVSQKQNQSVTLIGVSYAYRWR